MPVPKVSVVIAAYNAERWLGEAISSVLAQTFEDLEAIVVDDGSTDATQAVALGICDPRVKCIRRKNGGLAAARNTGIQAARGEFIGFLDADDRFAPEKLSKQLAVFEAEPGLDGVASGFDLIDDHGRWLRRELPWLTSADVNLRAVLFWDPILVCSLLLRRECLFRVGLFDESIGFYEDWDLSIRLALAGCRIGWVREALYTYRRHGSNMSTDPALVTVGTEAAIGFITRLFKKPDLPPEIRGLEGKVLGNLYLDAAARAFGAGRGPLGQEYLQAAVEYDPALLEGAPPRWVVALCGHALGPLVENGLGYLRTVAAHLPLADGFQSWNARRLVTHFHASRAFKLRQSGNRLPARLSGLRAVARDPRMMGNRGLLSITFRPW